jgi:hypothetical protein
VHLAVAGPRAQTNTATAYIDGNFVYGSNVRLADELRLLKGGLLKTLPAFSDLGLKDLMPLKLQFPDDGCIRSSPDIYCFLAGNVSLTKFRSPSPSSCPVLLACDPVWSCRLVWFHTIL